MQIVNGFLTSAGLALGISLVLASQPSARAADAGTRPAEDVENSAPASTASSANERQMEFKRWVAERFDDLGDKTNDLKARADKLGDKAKSHWKEFTVASERERQKVEAQLDQAKDVSAERWQAVKAETAKALQVLQDKYEELVDRMKAST